MKVRLVVLAALSALAVLPSTAFAGGFATVGLSSLPDDARPGEPWVVELTILQHGVTPLSGINPTVTIRNERRDTEIFDATPVAGKTGVYRAEVVFPSAGRWDYEVADGFTATHYYEPVDIRAGTGPAAAAPDDGRPWAAALLAALGAGALVALITALALRRRPRPVAAS